MLIPYLLTSLVTVNNLIQRAGCTMIDSTYSSLLFYQLQVTSTGLTLYGIEEEASVKNVWDVNMYAVCLCL